MTQLELIRTLVLKQIQIRLELNHAMREARKTHTLEQIGRAAGVTRQAVHLMLKEKK